MHDLNDLHLFACVVEAGGYAKAERATGIPRSRLSRRVVALEAALGLRLVHRTDRHFSVTDAGERVYRHARAIVDEARALDAAVAEVQGEPAGHVRVSAAPLTAELWLGRWVGEFVARHPKVRVTLSLSNRYVDLFAERFDLAIRFASAPLADADVVARPLGRGRMGVYASPALLAAHGTPRDLHALRALPAVVVGTPEAPRPWTFRTPAGEDVAWAPQGRFVVDHLVAAREAAIAGAGAVQLPPSAAAPAVAAGELCELLADHAPADTVVYAVVPSRKGMGAAVRELVAFLEGRFAALD